MTYDVKRKHCNTSVGFLALFLFMVQTPAQATIIYGMDHISQLSSKAKGPFYIQLGSFRSARNAKGYMHQLKTQGHYPTTVKKHGNYYTVMVGPLKSVHEVRGLTATTSPSRQRLGTSKAIVNNSATYKTEPNPSTHLQPLSDTRFFQARGFVQGDIGLSATQSTESMRVNNGAVDPYPANVDVYSTQNNTNGGMASIMAGLRWQNDRLYIPAYSLALRYQNMFHQAIKGTITQYSDPEFLNYNYNWKVQSNVFSLLAKIDLLEYKRFLPYVDVGVGYALNESGRYYETAFYGIVPRIDSPNFRKGSSNQFSYSLGAGLDYQLNQHMLVSVGYEFQDLGSLRSGFGQSPWSAGRLALQNYQTNNVLCSFSYLLGA